MSDPKRNKTAAKMNRVILQGISNVGTKTAGEAINRDPSFISRLKTGENKVTIEEVIALLNVCNLTIQESNEDLVTIRRSLYDSLTEFADIGLKFMKQDESE